MLKTYSDFLAYSEDSGAVVFAGDFTEGFPNLYDMTSPLQWHTGDPETDPWRWKDRAAAERRVAFGNILGGRKGFLSRALYPLFYSACRPDGSIEERYRAGYVKKLVLDVYRLFEDGAALDTGELRRLMNVRKSEGTGRSESVHSVDGAVVTLQREFYITVCGSRRKTRFDGVEYGWPANTYRLVDDWLAAWLTEPLLPTDEARARILAHITAKNGAIDGKKAGKLLFGKAL